MHTITVLAGNLRFPEGPLFDPLGRIWFVELENSSVTRLEADGSLARFNTGGIPDGLACDAHGHLFVCDKKKGILKLPADGSRFETLATQVDGEALPNPGDLCFDAAGNLVFTCLGRFDQPIGCVCRLRRDGTVERLAAGLSFPNGLAFDAAGRRLFVAETATKRLLASAYDPHGPLSLAPFAEVGGSTGPDGIALDAVGNVYVTLFGWAQIAVVDGAGRVIDRIGLPGGKPTNCAFDPTGARGLIVTEAELGRLLSVVPVPPGLRLFDGG